MVNQPTTIPPWLTRHLAQDDLAKIATAVRQVEVKTRAEIVPMIVKRSMVTGHVLPMIALILLVIYLGVEAPNRLDWWRGSAMFWDVIDLVVLVLVAWGLSRWTWLQRVLTADADEEAQVLRRAELEFLKAGLGKTKDATGILLFVSLDEHRAVVLADTGIVTKLDQKTWHEVVDLIVTGVKRDTLADGLAKAIGRCGELVSPHFPMSADDRNELRDALVIKE